MWLIVAICSGAIIMWIILAKERPLVTGKSTGTRLSILKQAKSVLRVRDVWLVATMEICISGALVSAIGLLPETLAERGTPSSTAGNYASLITWGVAAANIIGPYISDRVGLRKAFIWPLLLTSSACATFLGILTGAPLIVLIVAFSLGLGAVLPLFKVLIIENESVGLSLAGSALGVIQTVNRIGAILMPVAMGAIIDSTGQYWPGFFLLALLLAFGALVVLKVRETGFKSKPADRSI
ncbi:MFS transporter [Chloroflexota bacterium]